jgi:adenylate cyclase
VSSQSPSAQQGYVPPPARPPMPSSPTHAGPRGSVPPQSAHQPPGSSAYSHRGPGGDAGGGGMPPFRPPQGSAPRIPPQGQPFPQQQGPTPHGGPAHGTQAMPQMQYPGQGGPGQPGQPPQQRPPQPSFMPPGTRPLGPPGGPAPNMQARPFAGGRPRPPTLIGARVDLLDSARAIERQIAARTKGFLPYEQIAVDPKQLGFDYERLRITWELSRDIALERDLDTLLQKILKGIFKFVKADRGVALLKEPDGSLQPRAAHRRDGTEAPIEVSSTILNHVMTEKASVLTHDASSDFAASKGKSMIMNRISSAMVVPLLHEQEVLGALWLDSPALAQFQEKDLEVVTTVAGQAAMFIENILLTKKIEHEITTRERFSRLLSPNVAEQVISGKLEIKKGGVQVNDVTVFNSDIRGFTAMSEGTSAEMMVEILNEYFEQMVETIFKHEGTLDKFMGDGIMAFWGAPVAHDNDAIRATDSALEQMEALRLFNEKRAELSLPPLAIGMGLHTGPLVAGYVGSSKALSYTVIGDTANTSARLCGIALSGQILVSEATLAQLHDHFEYEELAPAALKGKEKPLRVFNVLARRVTDRSVLEGAPSVRSVDAV